MSDGLTYCYDGSFEGLLCCVFESFEKKETPFAIVTEDAEQGMLFAQRRIETDLQKADRVFRSIVPQMGPESLDFVRHSFLTCLPDKESRILQFLRLGYSIGPSVLDMLAHDAVHPLKQAVLHLTHEAHLLTGFVRFSVFSGALIAQIEPKNIVLPLMAEHFCTRYPEEHFLIHDRTNGMALVYRPHQRKIIAVEDLQMPDPDEEEERFRDLWRLFYKTIEVQGRHNPRCRMGLMPKRYWKTMTEFSQPYKRQPKLGAEADVLGRLDAEDND